MTEKWRGSRERKERGKETADGEKWIEREREKEENDESRGRTMTPFAHDRDDHPPSSPVETCIAPESSFTHVIVRPRCTRFNPYRPSLSLSLSLSLSPEDAAVLESHARAERDRASYSRRAAHLTPNATIYLSTHTERLSSCQTIEARNSEQQLFRAKCGTK